MEKLIMKIGSSEPITTDDSMRTKRMNYIRVNAGSSNRTSQFTSKQADRTYIRRTKTPAVSSSCGARHAMRIRKGTDLTCLDYDRKNFGGSVTKEIKLLFNSGQRLVVFSNKGQMKTVNSNVTIYNNRHKKDTGLKVKCRYDYDNLLILFYLTPLVQVSLEESQCDQEEPQCVPP